MTWIMGLFCMCAAPLGVPEIGYPSLASYPAVTIQIGNDAGPVEANAAQLLSDRIREVNGMPVQIGRERDAAPGAHDALVVLLGMPSHHTGLAKAFESNRIAPLTEQAPGLEGFLLQTLPGESAHTVLAAGVNPRGVVYAVGELLRRAVLREEAIAFPTELRVRTAPAFEVRGTQVGQSGVAQRLARVRPWTQAEEEHKIMDYVLAGANTIQVEDTVRADDPTYRYLKSFDIKTLVHYGPNTGEGPPEWQASESIGREGYLCPSVPAARAALLKHCDEVFKNGPDLDYVRFYAGDGGGCECDKCKPYGKTYIHLCEEMAAIIHRYHPATQIFATNQKLDNAGDNAIFEYLQEQPRPWLRAFCYGPGSDAMSWQPGHRQTHRMDLFRYPGFGPFDRYLKEILHQLPPRQDIVFFNEVTHWRYSQYGYIQMYPRVDQDGNQPPDCNHSIYERRPDQALTMVYDRLTFYAWPRYYHWVFGETERYGIGDVTHSSGTHDHFNQWMWQRLLWAPQTDVEDVVNEYARTWFGPEAAPAMAAALFQLEEYLQEDSQQPMAQKPGIDRYYQLVKDAGDAMPAFRRKGNWLWREFMQKAAIDKYVSGEVRQQLDRQHRIETRIAQALNDGALDQAIDEILPWFKESDETDAMRPLREEAGLLGEESNALYGVRSEGFFNLAHDFIGLGWLERQLTRAKAATAPEKAELLRMIVHYEDPGEGGFYDNLGTNNYAPHLVCGYPYDHGQPYVAGMLSEANRPSQRSMNFTQDEAQGLTFHYTGLDPAAHYRIRFTLARPWYQERYATRMNQKTETIYVDDQVLAKDVELPLQMSDFFTYDVPPAATGDGDLVIRLKKADDVATGACTDVEAWRNSGGWGTLVSEVWLMKRSG